MKQYYTNERNVQILIGLLKEHGIKKVIASPGSTNVTFVGSIQQDPFFEIYSCVDERSAAYMACGVAAETNEPVVLSCTGATASRNYFPALTEAYYRKLPILAVTSTQDASKVGHLVPQIIDRRFQPSDAIKFSTHLQSVKDDDDEWDCVIKTNRAILELNHHGKGPVHINLTTNYSSDFSVKDLPSVRKIVRYTLGDKFPEIPVGKVAIYVGSHLPWSSDVTTFVDMFCEKYNAAVFCEPTSNYHGQYRIDYELAASQNCQDSNRAVDLLIHIGDMSDMCNVISKAKHVWRISEDGELRDRWRSLCAVFEMSEESFFKKYCSSTDGFNKNVSYYQSCKTCCDIINESIPDLPFSHIWVASVLYDKLPDHSSLHLGILSPLRSWSYFNIPSTIDVYCNQGGFGIDGNMSSMIGASIVSPKKLFFGVVGDLSFFYDMNILGNRHIGSNIRILLVNNGLGVEFHLFKQLNSIYVNEIDQYISAGNHNGHKSPVLVKHFVTDLGFEYLSASDKDEFNEVYPRFIDPKITEKPILLEVFTDTDEENKALYDLWHIKEDTKGVTKRFIKSVVGKDGVNLLKKIVK